MRSACRSDGREVKAAEGMSILEAARGAGISIPTLCHHDKLQPYGGCRLCIVEAQADDPDQHRRLLRPRCGRRLVVTTRSETIDRIRKTILELLMAHAPDSPVLQEMAGEYGADRTRFEPEPAFCIHCGLCVRYCAEVVEKNAIGFIDRGVRRRSASSRRSPLWSASIASSASRSAQRRMCRRPFVLVEGLTSGR